MVGSYDDSVLNKIDGLLNKIQGTGIKLIIAMHDRYSLGCWASDAYVKKFDLPQTDCSQATNEPTDFYWRSDAQADFDNRLKHILSHRNPYFNNRTWSELGEVILAFDIENESQAYMKQVNHGWLCDRAAEVKPLLKNGVLVATGGGADFFDSMDTANFECPHLDVVTLHSYSGLDSITSNLETGKSWTTSFFPPFSIGSLHLFPPLFLPRLCCLTCDYSGQAVCEIWESHSPGRVWEAK